MSEVLQFDEPEPGPSWAPEQITLNTNYAEKFRQLTPEQRGKLEGHIASYMVDRLIDLGLNDGQTADQLDEKTIVMIGLGMVAISPNGYTIAAYRNQYELAGDNTDDDQTQFESRLDVKVDQAPWLDRLAMLATVAELESAVDSSDTKSDWP